MKDYMYLIPIVAGTLTILNYSIKFVKWTIENQQKTLKYSSLATSVLMSMVALSCLAFSPIAFYIKANATNNLQSAFIAFSLCITFVIGSLLFAKHHFKEYKNYKLTQ